MIAVYKFPSKEELKTLLKRPAINNESLQESVKSILKDVRENGDAAVKKYAAQFDKSSLLNDFQIPKEEWQIAASLLDEKLKTAIDIAIQNIRKFHAAQKEEPIVIETMPGVKCWRKSVAIEKVGLYIPGGTAPLFSTLLMLAIPAQLAGCSEIVVCTPINESGKIHPAILYAAQQTGVHKIFGIGGVQAIAAMAFGTETVPKVYKIFGPGNQYVTSAKMLLQSEGIAIDMPAGPSEVAVLADETCVPAFVAADLLSQAEHGVDSQVLLVSNSAQVVESAKQFLSAQIALLPRATIATEALKNSKAILVKTLEDGIELLNEYAPEHLIIACKNEDEIAEKVVNAGSVFIGNYSPESAGDYASGTNHTLPTNGSAKAYSGVSLDSFMKKITFQKLSKTGLENIGTTVYEMAMAEGLTAHANAITVRLNK